MTSTSNSLQFSIVLMVLITVSIAEYRENHFGNPCKLCECFIEYASRDISTTTLPYRMVKNAYNSTEDRCLATCLHDDRCKLAVYGLVGGREIFACELYDEVNLSQVIYVPYTNIYLRKQKPCSQPAHKVEPLWTIKGDQTVTARKNRYIKLALQQNPFNFG